MAGVERHKLDNEKTPFTNMLTHVTKVHPSQFKNNDRREQHELKVSFAVSLPISFAVSLPISFAHLGNKPPTKASRVQSPAGSLPDFRTWESCPTMPQVSGFSRESPVIPALAFRRCCISRSIFNGSQKLSENGAERECKDGKRETLEKTCRPAASSGTIPTCENAGVNQQGIEPGSPWWEASSLTAQPPWPLTFKTLLRAVQTFPLFYFQISGSPAPIFLGKLLALECSARRTKSEQNLSHASSEVDLGALGPGYLANFVGRVVNLSADLQSLHSPNWVFGRRNKAL
ncbi:hypothetical protein PR048_003604 [Dryococelus australis]|uniref:Uncharacterized protein n=1 Tax=Dryococelus australis TaxID=614101 RepID=A0ABQ9INI9_9NEOP|nr:hypothetical protein PR048_003604 [Dryococelus australis]